jgi:hypothetical protein
MTKRSWLAVAIVAVSLVAYPLATVAGGAPKFPTRADCVHAAVEGEPVNIVFGRFDSPLEAKALRHRVVAAGFIGTEVIADGCGRWEAVLQNVPSLEIARKVEDETRTVGLSPTLELGTGG